MDNKEQRLSRRGFLSGAGALGASLGYSLVVDAREFDIGERVPRSEEEIRAAVDVLNPADNTLRIAGEPNMQVVALACDFLVAGGGMAGVCAAIAAARNGAKVVLVQDRSRLGGNASSEVRMHIVGADHHGGRPGWREGGLIEEFRLENAVNNSSYHWEMWDMMLYDKVVSEPNITLILDASLYAVEVKGGLIQEALVRCDKTEHIYRIKAGYYADCTGDCRLGLEAGAVYRMGHESRDEFNEKLAPETSGPETLGSSILFTSKDMWEDVKYTPPKWARKITKEHLQHRGISSWEYGYWWIEWGGHISAIHDNERIRFELLSIVLGVWDYIKNSGDFPEAKTWAMDWIGMIPGKRSSRRLDGPHILTEQDLLSETPEFDDAVAIGGWPFDNHPPSGFDDPETPPYNSVKIKEVYSIPLRSLYSKNIGNLFMAGRNISASHVAFTSTRVMATCSVEGQAAGTAAAYCARHKLLPQALYEDKKALQDYRQLLLYDDQTIKGLSNLDANDLAKRATVTASNSVEGSAPEHAINGLVRDMPGKWENRWGGKMEEEGAWLQLSWDTSQKISHIQITFDTGFQRELTLTEHHGHRKKHVRAAQPETVRDYSLTYTDAAGKEQTLLKVEGNYQRLRRHSIDPIEAKSLRIQVHATNGSDEARIYEVRCYG